jgi:spore coat protein H
MSMKKTILWLAALSLLIFLASCDTVLIDPYDTVDDETIKETISSFDRLFDDSKRKELTIIVSESSWQALDDHMRTHYLRYGDYRDDTYVMADLLFNDESGDEIRIGAVGLRTRGNLSRTRIVNDQGELNMVHFKISFRETFNLNPTSEEYNILEKRTAFGLEELDMKYNRNMDPTYHNEIFALDLFQQAGVYAQETTMADVYVEIGGTRHHYGLYTLFEPIDDHFIERRLDASDHDGDLYKALWQQYGPAALQSDYPDGAIGIKDVSQNYRPAYDLKSNKKTSTHIDLMTFINDLNRLSGVAFETFAEERLDVTALLTYFAVGVLIGNPDDYRAMGNNFYIYFAPGSQTAHIFPYDYDHGLGQGWEGEQVFSNYTVGANIYDWGNLNAVMLGLDQYPHPLVDKLLAIPSYQVIYESILAQLTDPREGLFSYDRFLDMYEAQKALYEDDLIDAMFNLPFGLRNISWYIEAKTEDIRTQLNLL